METKERPFSMDYRPAASQAGAAPKKHGGSNKHANKQETKKQEKLGNKGKAEGWEELGGKGGAVG